MPRKPSLRKQGKNRQIHTDQVATRTGNLGLARIILGGSLGFPKCTIELKGAKERGS